MNNRMIKIVFPDSLDERVILAASQLVEEKIAQPVLIGHPLKIRNFCIEKGLPMPFLEIIHPSSSTYWGEVVKLLKEKLPKLNDSDIEKNAKNPLWFATALLKLNAVDICIAGNISSTADVLRAGIRIVGLEKESKTVSSIMFMVPPNRELAPDQGVLAFSDCGVVPVPTEDQLVDIAVHTAKNFSNAMKENAKVAMLSFSSHGSAKHENAVKINNVTQMIKTKNPNLVIDGELQFDAAFVPSVAAKKVPDSPLKGAANVFVFPGLEAANIGYKIAQRLGGYAAVGPMIQGLSLPIHDLSRGCSSDEIVQVSELAIKMAAL